MGGPERRPEPAEGWRIPPPLGRQPSLRDQLRSACWALIAVLLVINGVGIYWVWTTLSGRQHAASSIAGLLGAIGLGLLDLVAVALALYAWVGRQ